MMRALVITLALAACSKKAEPPAAGSGSAEPTVVSLGAEGLAMFEKFANEMCACPAHDARCGTAVNAAMNKWRGEAEANAAKLPRVTPQESEALGKKLKPVMNRYLQCALDTKPNPK
ncbi:MAG: hypothetical protein ABI867_25310 [Kofleriaceae bacterium]